MVTIIVKDNETNQEMILRVSIDSEETATVNVKFNPPLDKKKRISWIVGYYGKSGNECD